ncbi:bifunctional ADP-dependent NAD(P)H-hydrate dehydratase/NAD(P)H-hydrate epimerase [Paenibacillus ginsengihumi]|uniref:bifunctional ADP-dependent NAD(P)H-hydrate dehydratase/NAD(P)H-hydrate epimerase n=1 Tax=Paenibacillus ginsengihumi TaxID=431596 RepID=UPI000374360E|nr:bifunctional ADP-dependent NAD(P)H-hydrate dehydratase/NAD(P)H-hydrate epimerase [Paenibacillus ginsengihumi]
MHAVTAEEMREIDRYVIEQLGIPALVLMENAGRAVAEEVMRLSGGVKGRWLIAVGKGNNGADGIVAARHLKDAGYDVHLLYAASRATLRGEAAVQRDIAERCGLPSADFDASRSIDWSGYSGIVDALLGTGSRGAPRDAYAELIRQANGSGLPIVAVDIPSGLDADTGAVSDPCIRAIVTVALAFTKRGLEQHPGAEYAGRTVVRYIGIPPALADSFGVNVFTTSEQIVQEKLDLPGWLQRKENTHKGTYGHLVLAAGSRNMSGAGLLCAKAALRSGAGLATWAMPDVLVPIAAGRVPEVMLAGLAPDGEAAHPAGGWEGIPAEALAAVCRGKSALVVGPGMGRFRGDSRWLRELWERTDCPLVADADALNMIADAPDFAAWKRRSGAAAVLTPHPGEMARLTGLPVHEVQRDRIGLARRYAIQHGVTLVLKGSRTVCAAPDGVVFVNTTGHPGMATAGAGDVLAGLIGGLLAQGLDAGRAAALGVYLHGAAGERAAAKRSSPAALIAGDIVEEL